MSTAINYKIRQCSKCSGNTEYVCNSCPCELCRQCTENHIHDLTTIDHNVVVYRDTLNFIPNQNTCLRHVDSGYGLYCKNCDLPTCSYCLLHREHRLRDVRTEYETKRQRHKETIHMIKSATLFSRSALLSKIEPDFQKTREKFSFYQSEILPKAKTLKHLVNKVMLDLLNNVFCDFDIKHRCLKQSINMTRHLAIIRRYEKLYEQSAVQPIEYLCSKKKPFNGIQLTKHTSNHLMTQAINEEMVTQLLDPTELRQSEKRCVKNEDLLKLMSGPEFHQSLTVTDVDCCNHMSPVSSDLFWISYIFKLILTDVTGETFYSRKDLYRDLFIYGSHTVNKDGDLFFIDRELNIIKQSKDMNTTKIFIKRNYSTWRPYCVYFSAFTDDLLVGVYDRKSKRGEVKRYNQIGQNTQTLEYENSDFIPHYITENNNGDVVVSDASLIVATDRRECRRFNYTGHPPESGLQTLGLSTDALSHILVCDGKTHTVQMIDRDGQFLSLLLIRPFGIFQPCSLSYDVNSHRLWVGSLYNNKVCVYKYITRKIALIDTNTIDVNSPNTNNARDTETIQDGNSDLNYFNVEDSLKTNHNTDENTIQKGLLKMSGIRFNHSISVTGIYSCYHISFAQPNMMWVSDANNLILTNKTGDIKHHVTDLSSTYNGIHTVNSESELIYISSDGYIKKISKDMKTITFIEQSEKLEDWTPQCVYWSSSTNDLLIGMRSKVSRYNLDTGNLTQAIQYDKTGKLEIYCNPNYITENNNGDIVVSDFGAVVVTDCLGGHRFSYTGYRPGSGLDPRGICTDALSHILVCDYTTKTVQMLDRDGMFLCQLLAGREEIDSPHSLSYDVNTHRLYVGSDSHNKNTVNVYKYITRQDKYDDKYDERKDEYDERKDEYEEKEYESELQKFPYEYDVMFSSTPAV